MTDHKHCVVEQQERFVQQRMSALLTTLFSARKQLPYTSNNTTKASEAEYRQQRVGRAGEQGQSQTTTIDNIRQRRHTTTTTTTPCPEKNGPLNISK